MNSFTQEDLLLYMYKETSPQKTAAISAALETDFELRDGYEALTSAQESLETINVSPRKKALDFILNYAEKVNETAHV